MSSHKCMVIINSHQREKREGNKSREVTGLVTSELFLSDFWVTFRLLISCCFFCFFSPLPSLSGETEREGRGRGGVRECEGEIKNKKNNFFLFF